MPKITKRYRISTPEPGYTGYIGVVAFLNGHAEVEVDIDDQPLEQGESLDLRVMRAAPAFAHFIPNGYVVEDLTPDVLPGVPAEPVKASATKSKETPA